MTTPTIRMIRCQEIHNPGKLCLTCNGSLLVPDPDDVRAIAHAEVIASSASEFALTDDDREEIRAIAREELGSRSTRALIQDIVASEVSDARVIVSAVRDVVNEELDARDDGLDNAKLRKAFQGIANAAMECGQMEDEKVPELIRRLHRELQDARREFTPEILRHMLGACDRLGRKAGEEPVDFVERLHRELQDAHAQPWQMHCSHCGAHIAAHNGEPGKSTGVARERFLAHDRDCPKNPLVVELQEARKKLDCGDDGSCSSAFDYDLKPTGKEPCAKHRLSEEIEEREAANAECLTWKEKLASYSGLGRHSTGCKMTADILDALRNLADSQGCPETVSLVDWFSGYVKGWRDEARERFASMSADLEKAVQRANAAEGASKPAPSADREPENRAEKAEEKLAAVEAALKGNP